MTLTILGSLAGGIGLFLLGMRLITEGLKLAAGHTLRNVLASSTSTSARGLLSGALITSLVQSSGAVTVATIGFVNAGLMSLAQAVTVIYGTNIGTTVTGWLVAAAGFDIDIKAFALPAVGIGMFLRLCGGERRYGSLGEALAGFGVFFIGLDVLKTAFGGLGEGIQLEALWDSGFGNLLLFVGVGFLLTFLMQSSSAAIAVILTSAGGDFIPVITAAAMVIGANVGSTSTAALAVLGATSNAKRVAAAHMAFNLITGVVAFLNLSFILALVENVHRGLKIAVVPVTVLALFHTTFNALGIALLWPLTGKFVRFLERRFRVAEEDEARPRYLDRTVVTTPVLAMHALTMELARIGDIARRMTKSAISSEGIPGARLAADRTTLDRLVVSAGEFSTLMQRSNLPPELSEVLPNALRVSRYYSEMAELAVAVAKAQSACPTIEQAELAAEINHFRGMVVKLLDTANTEAEGYSFETCAKQLEALEKEYQRLKSGLLRAGTEGQLSVRIMVDRLDTLSNIRRIAQQSEKGARYLTSLNIYTAASQAEGSQSKNI
jgi:phosphate:Na+ symporter